MNSIRKWRSSTPKLKIKVNDCDTAERLILWALRLWAAGKRQNVAILSHLMEGFRLHGNAQAASNLIMLMESMVTGLHRNFEINCACYIYVGEDERIILETLAICQKQNSANIQPLLSKFLNDEAVMICQPLFHDLAEALMAGALFLSESHHQSPTLPSFEIAENESSSLIH